MTPLLGCTRNVYPHQDARHWRRSVNCGCKGTSHVVLPSKAVLGSLLTSFELHSLQSFQKRQLFCLASSSSNQSASADEVQVHGVNLDDAISGANSLLTNASIRATNSDFRFFCHRRFV